MKAPLPAKLPSSSTVDPPAVTMVWLAVMEKLFQPSRRPSTSTAPKPNSRTTSPLRSATLSRRVE